MPKPSIKHLQKLLLGLIIAAIAVASILGAMLWQIDQRMIEDTLQSKTLGEERSIRIFLPSNYGDTPHRHFDVLYTLDGERFRNSHMPMLFSTLLPHTPNIIIVAINGEGKRMRDFSAETARAYDGRNIAGKASKFLEFMANELIPHIQTQYRVTDTRLLAGHSMGGLFTTQTFIEKPNLFEGYLAFSPTYPANILMVNQLTTALQTGQHHDHYLYLNVGLERIGGYKTRIQKAEHILEKHCPTGLRYNVSYYPLIHGMVMIPGYLEGLSGFYLPKE